MHPRKFPALRQQALLLFQASSAGFCALEDDLVQIAEGTTEIRFTQPPQKPPWKQRIFASCRLHEPQALSRLRNLDASGNNPEGEVFDREIERHFDGEGAPGIHVETGLFTSRLHSADTPLEPSNAQASVNDVQRESSGTVLAEPKHRVRKQSVVAESGHARGDSLLLPLEPRSTVGVKRVHDDPVEISLRNVEQHGRGLGE